MSFSSLKTDVAIIGAGIIGCAVARELSKYKLSISVVEKEADVGWGTTKANSGIIHAGYAGEKGTLKLAMSHKGNLTYKKAAEELDIPIRNTGSLLNVFYKSQITYIENLLDQGKRNGVTGLEIILNKNGNLKKIEPNISDKVIASLHAPETCITSPYEAAIALFENAKDNSVNFLLNREVSQIFYDKSKKCFYINFINKAAREDINDTGIKTDTGACLEASIIINSAGIFSDCIANMVGDDSFYIKPVKGQYLLFDSETSGYVKKINFRITDKKNIKSKGLLVSPTMGDNFFIGPNYEESNKYDHSITKKGIDEIKKKISEMFLNIPFNKVIASFTGLRAVSDSNDFIIAPSKVNEKFINAAGIQSPGLTCAFVIAEMIADIVKDVSKKAGLSFGKNPKFVPDRKRISKLNKVNFEENIDLYNKNNQYGEVICRCEKVSEAEIIDAIKRGANTIDGVKFRTRAGMGRCQGGYCTLRVMKILSRELNIPFESITKSGGDSYLGKIKME